MAIFYLLGGIVGLAIAWMLEQEPPPLKAAPLLSLLLTSAVNLAFCRLWVWICSKIITLKWVSHALTAGQDASWWKRLLLYPLVKLQEFTISFIAVLCAPVAIMTSACSQALTGSATADNPFDIYAMIAGMIGIAACGTLSIRYILMDIRPQKPTAKSTDTHQTSRSSRSKEA